MELFVLFVFLQFKIEFRCINVNISSDYKLIIVLLVLHVSVPGILFSQSKGFLKSAPPCLSAINGVCQQKVDHQVAVAVAVVSLCDTVVICVRPLLQQPHNRNGNVGGENSTLFVLG